MATGNKTAEWPIPLTTRAEYDRAQTRLDELLWSGDTIGPNHPDRRELNLLKMLVHQYNETHFPAEEIDPVDYLKWVLEQRGMKQKDLVPLIGNKASVSLVMNRKRRLTLEQAKRLHSELSIPAEILLRA